MEVQITTNKGEYTVTVNKFYTVAQIQKMTSNKFGIFGDLCGHKIIARKVIITAKSA